MPKAFFSDDRQYYYLDSDQVNRPRTWLSVEKFDGPVPPEKQGGMFDGYVQFTVPYTGEVYHRRSMPFQFWKVQNYDHYHRAVSFDDDLYIDYVIACGWLFPESPEWKERIQQRIDRTRYSYNNALAEVTRLANELRSLGAEP